MNDIHNETVNLITIDDKDEYLITCGYDLTIRIFDLNCKSIKILDEVHSDWISTLA